MEPVEVRDASGRVLGHYTPVLSPEQKALQEKANALFDMEEAKRDAVEGRGLGVSPDEVMRFVNTELLRDSFERLFSRLSISGPALGVEELQARMRQAGLTGSEFSRGIIQMREE